MSFLPKTQNPFVGTKIFPRQPAAAGSVVTFHDRFEILSLSAGRQGQVVGGNVVGALIASGLVIIIAASFTNVAYERLPLDEEETLQMQPPVSHPSGRGGGGGGMSSQFPDPSLGLPFLNLPLNMPNGQLPMMVHGPETRPAGHNIRSKLRFMSIVIVSTHPHSICHIIT
ncbi:AT-hook motif nuclear-localized protein 23 [Forsythia ovata]|uniref:AT-hook motif nuclear-localized protein 23 n=1 Tax=Forsythia ovata TaxID=205694 RepID=A0ABD1RKM8_9LAMI